MTNATELREMSDDQLELTSKEAKEKLFRLRIQAQTERLDAPSELRNHRRLIARVNTIQRERDLAAEGETDSNDSKKSRKSSRSRKKRSRS